MAYRAIPDDNIVSRQWEGLRDSITEMIGDVICRTQSFGSVNRGGFNIDGIDVAAFDGTKIFSKKAIAATNIQQNISISHHHRTVEGSIERLDARGSFRKKH
jgi:hypothetical protein